MKICIIDDNKKITEMLSEYLNLSGHDITVANNGRNGLALIERNKFDSIILDIAMPEFSGFDVINELKKAGNTEGKKIFVLTALSLKQDEIDELKQKGVLAVLNKPINLDELLKTIEGNG